MMKLSEILRLAWVNIVQNKSRMLMTSLGIVVGAATVVMVLAIGKGGQADVADQFKNLNAGAIEVTVGTGFDMDAMMMDMMGGMPGGMGGNMPNMSGGGFSMPSMSGGSFGRSGGSGMPSMGGAMGGGGGSMGGGRAGAMPDTRMTQDDVADIATYVSNLQEVTIYQSDSVSVFGGVLEESTNATVVGALEGYQNVSNLNVLYGRFLSNEDDAYADYVTVIGYDLAAELFEYAAMAYGDFIQIDDKNYEIVGVLERMGSVTSGISPDSTVFIPYSTAEKHVFGSTLEPTIAAVANDVDNVEQCMADIEAVLTENHPNAFFDVTDAGAAMEAASSSANTLAMLLFAVATIVFIVGGIGIMNVLFASVQERTQEIGILRAIGCARKSILLEFLLEAVIISMFGGLVGVGFSYALMPLVEMFGVRCEAQLGGALLAFGFAILTGTVFGFYPAWKASRLVPIEALNLN